MPTTSTSESHPRRPRILLGAYACEPNRGSEPGVGWNRALETARFCDTWVLCEASQYGAAIVEHLQRRGPIPGLNFVHVQHSQLKPWLEKAPGLRYTAYRLWQRAAYRVARDLHARIGFDLVHQVTFCGYREPGYLWRLGVPFVWGPIGGTQNYPSRFLGLAGWKGGAREAFRTVLNNLQLRFSPLVRQAVRHAAVILAANTTVQRDFAARFGVQPLLQLETGLHQVATVPRPVSDAGAPLRLLWSGDLQPWKALPLLLHALARIPRELIAEVRILGRGPLAGSLVRLAETLGVADRVRWLGWVPLDEALAQYRWADVFVFTSLRDTSGNVVLEALAAGLPVVCLDHQGVHDIITPESGIPIAVKTPEQVIDDLARALTELAGDPQRRRGLGLAALARARKYLWDRQGERMLDVYRGILGDGFLWDERPREHPCSQPTTSVRSQTTTQTNNVLELPRTDTQ